MYRQQRIAVVIPIHNEELFIVDTINSLPTFVDQIIVVDDGSCDNTLRVLTAINNHKVKIIAHTINCGVGAATISGYQAALNVADIIAVIDGDGQMDARELPALIEHLIEAELDYVKGNRFLHASISTMPRLRYLGNRVFSLLMQKAIGLNNSIDAQCGFTAIRASAIGKLDLTKLYPRYGFLNTLLFQLASAQLKVGCIAVRTIYGDEVSGINPFITVPTILYIIARGYFDRLATNSDNTDSNELSNVRNAHNRATISPKLTQGATK